MNGILKLKKKASGLFLTGLLLVGALGVAIPAMANNYSDSDFKFSLSNSMKYTGARKKTDKSKLYMKCKSVSVKNASYTAHAIGTNSKDKTGTDCSRGRTYNFSAGSTHYMTSWVKENGFKYARIGASPNYSYSFTAKGVWSPDNYNKY